MTTTDDALALAEAERAFARCAGTPYGHSVHVTDETRTIVRRALREMREGNAALRALAGAQERAEKAEARVRELEASLAWWRDSEAEMRRQRDRLKKLFSWLVERQIQKERRLERRHAAELSDMRAMVRGYRAALGEGVDQ